VTVLAGCYAGVDEIKQRCGLTGTADDADVTAAIRAASRALDFELGQTFTATASATARVFAPTSSTEITIAPFYDLAGLVVATDVDGDGVFETTWASADYELGPLGGFDHIGNQVPWRTIRAVGSKLFPVPVTGSRLGRLQVTAKWGWAAPPAVVTEACRILSTDLWKRKHAPFGIQTATVEFGGLRIGRDLVANVRSLVEDLDLVEFTGGIA
jgi:hypothetical protein